MGSELHHPHDLQVEGGVPIRMPKGPEGFDENSFNGGEKNFARRVRRGALEVLRSAGQGNGGRRGV